MSLLRKFQNAFTSGEISPSMYSRMDYQKYASSCRLVRNAVVRPQGGAVKRGGLLSCWELPVAAEDATDYTKCVMFPFVYNVNQSCVLLFVPFRVYVISGGSAVTNADGTPVSIATHYSGDELRSLSVCQSNDVLFIAHPNHPPAKLSRLATTLQEWSFDDFNIVPKINPPGKVTITKTGFDTYNPNGTDAHKAKFRDIYYRVSAVADDGEESLPSAEASEKIPVKWATTEKSAKVVIAWEAVPGAKRYHVYKNASGAYGWIGTTEKLSFTDTNYEGDSGVGYKQFGEPFRLEGANDGARPAPVWITAKTITATTPGYDSASFTGKGNYSYVYMYYKVAAVTDSGLVGMASEYRRVLCRYLKPAPTEATLSAYRAALAAVDCTFTIKWKPVSNVAKYYVYAALQTNTSSNAAWADKDADYFKVAEVTQPVPTSGTTPLPGEEGDGNSSSTTTMPTEVSFTEKFSGAVALDQHPNTAYPGVVSIFQQRLVFARSNLAAQTIWASETGAFNSFSTHYPLIDSDSITLTLDSRQANEIRHIIAMKSILVMTSAAEYVLNGKNGETQALTPSSANCQVQSFWGASEVSPITFGIDMVFATDGGRKVRNMQYKFTEDGFVGNELSIVAEHLFPTPVIDWALQKNPYGVIWICRSDGALVTLTYLEEQGVVAWSRHDSADARFISTSCIHEGGRDVAYFLVERTFNGVKHYYVEQMAQREQGDGIGEGVFLDMATRIADATGGSADAVKALYKPLAGQKITVVADGSVDDEVTVAADGSIPLPAGASHYVVGLPYVMQLQTVPFEITSQEGTMLANRKSLVACNIDIEETQGVCAGSDFGHLEIVDYPPPATPTLRSGVYKVTQLGNFGQDATVCIESRQPYPCIIRGIESVIDVGQN